MGSLTELFAAEAEETLAALEQGLLGLERGGEPDLLHEVFRAAHNLKGAAKVAGYADIGELAHVAEELLVRLRDRKLPISKGMITILLASVDELRCLLAAAFGGGTEATTAVASTSAGHAASHASVRVGMERLDQLVELTGEILMERSRIGALLRTSDRRAELTEAHAAAGRLYDELRDQVMGLKLVPIAPIFQAQVRAIRDGATALGKQVRIEIVDHGAQIDATLASGLRDPLIHILRNAIDHGMEAPDDRVAAGKDACGLITLQARRDGGWIEVTVSDDGRGFNRKRIRDKAIARGDIAPDAVLDDRQLMELVLLPGFSTAATVTEISGRGVGMDVVRRNIEALRGTLQLSSREGLGSTVTIRLPLSLAIIAGFQVGVGGDLIVVPCENVVECSAYAPRSSAETALTTVVSRRGRPLPVVDMRTLFGVDGTPDRQSLVVVQHRNQELGLVVDRLDGEAPTLVKPFTRLLARGGPVAAAALTGAERVALVLDLDGVLRAAHAAAST